MIGLIRLLFCTLVMCMVSVNAIAQSGSGSGFSLNKNYHISFERPEAWGLKYFISTSLLSGLQPPELSEAHKVGSISVGMEVDWIPALDAGQRRIGFYGKKIEDLNKAPILVRPVVRIGLPWKFTAVAAAPPPFEVFGVTSHLLAFGLERPILERKQWTLSWRGYGQVGSVKGAFTCPQSALGFPRGSPENPSGCVAESADVASLRYAGNEFQFAYRPRRMPRLVPHAAVGGNFIDGAFDTHAPLQIGLDRTREWTRGGTFSTSGGVSYLLTSRASFTVDMFYSPLWVERSKGAPRTNDGLFNVRAFLNYTFR
jgi:hypothetical protein